MSLSIQIKVCPNRIDTQFLSIISKDVRFRKFSWKKKLLVIISPNKIGGELLENVFLFVQIYSIYTDFTGKPQHIGSSWTFLMTPNLYG